MQAIGSTTCDFFFQLFYLSYFLWFKNKSNSIYLVTNGEKSINVVIVGDLSTKHETNLGRYFKFISSLCQNHDHYNFVYMCTILNCDHVLPLTCF